MFNYCFNFSIERKGDKLDTLKEIMRRISNDHMQRSLDNEVKDICPICQNNGWVAYDKDGYTYCKECECGIREKQIMKGRLSFANIPEAFKDVRLSNFDIKIYNDIKSQIKIKATIEVIEYWLNNFKIMKEQGMGLYLYSETKGSGKTRMAASIANELIYEKHIQVKFATSLQILNEIKASWDNRDREYSENNLLDFLCTSEVLIIDDFGTEQVKDWIEERFYQIINTRYVNKKITIFTSNLQLEHLKYDDRIISRIKERVFSVSFPEESVRDIIAAQNMSSLVQQLKGERNK